VCSYGYYAFKHPSDTTIRICVKYCQMVGSVYYYADDPSRSCVTNCPMFVYGTYGDKIDFKCVSYCSRGQFRDNSTGTCVYSCPSPTFADNTTFKCLEICSDGFFAEDINNTCVKYCPAYYFGYNKTCVPQCPFGTYYYNDNTTWLCV
jgi:hypothetical protein